MPLVKKSRDHLDEVHETYAQHMGFAVPFGLRMIGAGFAILVHALIPALFQKTGSTTVRKLHEEMTARQNRPPHGKPPSAAA